jgi:hypothetical protein
LLRAKEITNIKGIDETRTHWAPIKRASTMERSISWPPAQARRAAGATP